MPIVRAGTVLLCAAAATTLAGCTGSRLSPDAPAGVTLAGAWKLNRTASDDPQKVLERMRAEAFKRIAEGTRDNCPVSRALKGNVELSVTATLEH